MNKFLFLPALIPPVLYAWSAPRAIAQNVQEHLNPSDDKINLIRLRGQLEKIEQRLADIEGQVSDISVLKEKTSWIERDLTNSLMDISNVLAVSGVNMDAAHATIEASQSAVSASEAYLSLGSYAAAILGIIVALAAIAAAITLEITNRKIRDVASTAADDIIKEFVSSSNGAPNHGTKKVLEAVRDSVKKDLEETPAKLMQNKEFREMLKRLVNTAVSAKPAQPQRDDRPREPLDPNDFAK
ncbi:hypothetical protein HGD90_05180 [Rhodobacteraceae bacterium R_SAG7]|nr:hypothetical protein [Rhodobacteraceae bacterium R_SAG7]